MADIFLLNQIAECLEEIATGEDPYGFQLTIWWSNVSYNIQGTAFFYRHVSNNGQRYYGEDFTVKVDLHDQGNEHRTWYLHLQPYSLFVDSSSSDSSGNYTLDQVASEIALRLIKIFEKSADGSATVARSRLMEFVGTRAVFGDSAFLNDKENIDCLLFFEYFNGDSGKGIY